MQPFVLGDASAAEEGDSFLVVPQEKRWSRGGEGDVFLKKKIKMPKVRLSKNYITEFPQ